MALPPWKQASARLPWEESALLFPTARAREALSPMAGAYPKARPGAGKRPRQAVCGRAGRWFASGPDRCPPKPKVTGSSPVGCAISLLCVTGSGLSIRSQPLPVRVSSNPTLATEVAFSVAADDARAGDLGRPICCAEAQHPISATWRPKCALFRDWQRSLSVALEAVSSPGS
jgi:hypothetical protein